MQARSEYNVKPASVTKDILFVDLYKMWSEEKYQNFENLMKTDGEYFIANKKSLYSYSVFKNKFWIPLNEELGTNHLPHDTRHTCVSRLAEAKVEQTIIKKIVGHVGAMSVTEKVYTHYDIKPLLEAVNLI